MRRVFPRCLGVRVFLPLGGRQPGARCIMGGSVPLQVEPKHYVLILEFYCFGIPLAVVTTRSNQVRRRVTKGDTSAHDD